MEQSNCHLSAKQVIGVSRGDRWQICQRLQELDIPCHCAPDGTLQVAVNSPVAAVQLWSVLRQRQAPRPKLVSWLKHCWQIKA